MWTKIAIGAPMVLGNMIVIVVMITVRFSESLQHAGSKRLTCLQASSPLIFTSILYIAGALFLLSEEGLENHRTLYAPGHTAENGEELGFREGSQGI